MTFISDLRNQIMTSPYPSQSGLQSVEPQDEVVIQTPGNTEDTVPSEPSVVGVFSIIGDESSQISTSEESTSLNSFISSLKERGFFVPEEQLARNSDLDQIKQQVISELKKYYLNNELYPDSLKDLLLSVEEAYQLLLNKPHLPAKSFYSQCLKILDSKGFNSANFKIEHGTF